MVNFFKNNFKLILNGFSFITNGLGEFLLFIIAFLGSGIMTYVYMQIGGNKIATLIMLIISTIFISWIIGKIKEDKEIEERILD